MPSASCCTRPSGPAAVPSSPAPGPSLRTAGNEGSGHLDASLQTHLVASPLSPRSPELARSGSQSPVSAKRPCTDAPLLGPAPRARTPPDVRASWAVCSGCRPGRGRTNAAQTSGHRAVPEARCRRRGLLACGCGRRARDDVPATAASHARDKGPRRRASDQSLSGRRDCLAGCSLGWGEAAGRVPQFPRGAAAASPLTRESEGQLGGVSTRTTGALVVLAVVLYEKETKGVARGQPGLAQGVAFPLDGARRVYETT